MEILQENMKKPDDINIDEVLKENGRFKLENSALKETVSDLAIPNSD